MNSASQKAGCNILKFFCNEFPVLLLSKVWTNSSQTHQWKILTKAGGLRPDETLPHGRQGRDSLRPHLVRSCRVAEELAVQLGAFS
jgi:hypothetical protein